MRRQRTIAGLLLIALGIAFYALQNAEIGHSIIFFVIGGIFLAVYFYRAEYGFLIPGCILTGLGVGVATDHWLQDFGEPALLGLGSGFLGIFLIDLIYQRRTHWWPLIPGGVLILLSLPNTERALGFLFNNWPLLLVLAGIVVLISSFGIQRSSSPQ